MELNLKIIVLASDARSYYDAYKVLQEKKSDLSREQRMNLSSPALVCLAFSIELHLKLLLRTHDIKATGHDIEKLLKKLPEDDIVFISTHEDFDFTQQGQNFFKNIAMASNLFIRTRYHFENLETLHFNTGFCVTLAKVIRKRIVQRFPYLTYDLGSFSD